MQIFENIINVPLGYVLSFAYKLVGSYGLALILFTLFIKLVLLPLGIKQQKSQINMLRVKPKEEAIRKKYANNKEKLNQEIMALYQAENANPMSGCLPLLIQFPILIGLYGVINKPLTYIMHLTSDHLAQIDAVLGTTTSSGVGYNQINAAHLMAANMDKVSSISNNIIAIDFNFLGMDLSQKADFKVISLLWVIPIIAAITSYLSGIVSQKLGGMNSGDNAQTAGMNKSMLLMMPIMSLWISFTTPAAMGFYWTISNLLIMLQTYVLSRFYNPQEALAKAKAEMSLSNNQKKKQRRILRLEQDKVLAEEAEELKKSEQEDQ